MYVVSPTLGNTAHDPGCRIWVIWPENTMTWPKSRILGRQMDPLRRDQSMGFGGQSGNSLNLRLAKHFFEKGVIPKGPTACQKLLCEPEIQTCSWLAPLWVTLRTTRGAGFDDLARKYYDVAKVADLGRQTGPIRGGQSMGFGG